LKGRADGSSTKSKVKVQNAESKPKGWDYWGRVLRERGYTVFVPSLPGRISEGETRKEALANIQEAIELYLEPVADDSDFAPDAEIVVK
jgi:predicted RNase H-like HicB family nuclease